jgi:hypothetical protein
MRRLEGLFSRKTIWDYMSHLEECLPGTHVAQLIDEIKYVIRVRFNSLCGYYSWPIYLERSVSPLRVVRAYLYGTH